MNPYWTLRALREYKRNFTWKGMYVVVRVRGKHLVFQARDEYSRARGLTDGVFT